jgi:CRISPR type III-A-associated protein Csm2
MADTQETEQEPRTAEEQSPPHSEKAEAQAAPAERSAPAERPERPERKPPGDRPQGDRPPGERRGPAPQGPGREGGNREGGGQGPRREGGGPGNREGRGGPHGAREGGRGERGDDRRGGDRGRFEGPPEIDIEKLISDPLYLDNQAHGVVSRMRDMDSGTKSQLRRLYNAVRRAVRAPENERQQQFVMLRARLAYTIARHSLRSLDSLEKLLLQVTRKNDARGYERFRDLFEAIVAYNE